MARGAVLAPNQGQMGPDGEALIRLSAPNSAGSAGSEILQVDVCVGLEKIVDQVRHDPEALAILLEKGGGQ